MGIFTIMWLIWFGILVAVSGPLFFDNNFISPVEWFVKNQILLLILLGGSFILAAIILFGIIDPMERSISKEGDKG